MTRASLGCLACVTALACSDPAAPPPAAGTAGTAGTAGASGAAQAGGTGGTTSDAGGSGGSGGAGALTGAGGSLVPGTWGPEACPSPAGGVGYDVGDSLGELTVIDCDNGEPRSIDELCGASATWIFAAHSHCPTCKATAGFTPSVAKQVAGKNVAIAHVMYDDNGTSCAAWKLAYELDGLPNVKVYEDPTGAVWSKLKTSNYTAPSAFLDAERVITFKAHGLTESAVLSRIDEALAK